MAPCFALAVGVLSAVSLVGPANGHQSADDLDDVRCNAKCQSSVAALREEIALELATGSCEAITDVYELGGPVVRVTATLPPLETDTPTVTPDVVYPLAPGSLDKAGGCLRFAQHRPIPTTNDGPRRLDRDSLRNTVNTCDYQCYSNGVYLDELIEWNPSLGTLHPCELQPGFRYCVDHINATEIEEEYYSPCLEITVPPEPGTIDTCSCFTLVQGFDAGLYLCEDIAYDGDFTIVDLLSWNPWIGSSEADCDAGLYAGLTGSDERALCINGTGGLPPGTELDPPGPTQPGIVKGCRAYHLASAHDSCVQIVYAHVVGLDDLYAWNPALNGDCSGLWAGYAYCVKGPLPTSMPPSPPEPTQQGTIETCQARVELGCCGLGMLG